LTGAVRLTGWISLGTMFASSNRERFTRWLRTRLLPKLRSGDVLVMDNATAHHAPDVASSARLLASGSCTCRRTRLTSIRSNRDGHFRNSTLESTHPETRAHFAE
ncbi:MAG TPA: hypothetical protein VLM79_33245, partial [Kofleriaceae bacterium]|nr:hypothetical protein [Kofleriaceae bacterium]